MNRQLEPIELLIEKRFPGCGLADKETPLASTTGNLMLRITNELGFEELACINLADERVELLKHMKMTLTEPGKESCVADLEAGLAESKAPVKGSAFSRFKSSPKK